MGTSGGGGLDPAAAVAESLGRTAAAAGDAALERRGRRLYLALRDVVDPAVRGEGAVLVAFPSVLVGARRPRACLVLGLPATILVAVAGRRWERAPEAARVERSHLARIEVVSAPPGSPVPLVLTVDDGRQACAIGLPRGVDLFGG